MRRVELLLPLLGLLLALLPLAGATHIVGDVGHDQGCTTAENDPCDDAAGADPLVPAVPQGGNSAAKAQKPDLLATVGDALQDAAAAVGDAAAAVGRAVGDAAGATVAAVGAALGAIGAVVMDALRSYARWLLGFKPATMPLESYAGIAAGSTAVAASGAQLGSWWLWRKVAPWLALVPGFSRIAKDELLDHERRARIFEMIRQNPGVHLSEMSSVLQIPWGSCMHHLRKLRGDRLIMFKSVGAHKCYFINGSGLSDHDMQALSLLKGDTTNGVASYIESHPRTSLKELAAGLGISPPLASFHVAKLEKAGLVQKVRDGRATRLVLAARLPGQALMPGAVAATVAPAPQAA